MKFRAIQMTTLYSRTDSQSCCIVFLQFNIPSVHKITDRLFTYNAALGHVGVTNVAVQKQYVLHILRVCLWPEVFSTQDACAILYFHLWPTHLYNMLLRYLINGKIFC